MSFYSELKKFYSGRTVLVTGHNGFKGSWLTKILTLWGAKVIGISLPNKNNEILFEVSGLKNKIDEYLLDIREITTFTKVLSTYDVDVIFHLAAQPLVRESYLEPYETYETNVLGTLNLLEALRMTAGPVKSVVVVTTDKVYLNREWLWGYREDEPLNGFDPYSNSKSCADLLTQSYYKCFLEKKGIAVSTVRAGNVIGGGDRSTDRIIPDCVRAASRREKIIVRNPYSTRPYQHVLEPLSAYLLLGSLQYQNQELATAYNIGPDDEDCVNTGELVSEFCESWGDGQDWTTTKLENAPHEANFLKLDSSKVKAKLGWKPRWHLKEAIKYTVDWEKGFLADSRVPEIMDLQIAEYFK